MNHKSEEPLVELDALVEIEKYEYLFLGRLAIEKGLIVYQQLLEALLVQHQLPEAKLGTILLGLGYISKPQLESLVEEQGKYVHQTPEKWSMVPDFVLKGLVYFGNNKLGNAESKHLRQAQQMRGKYQKEGQIKTLIEILRDDLQVISQEEISAFQRRITIHLHHCPKCSRRYQLFSQQPDEKLNCPVCWTSTLERYVEASPASSAVRAEIPPASPPGRKKKNDPLASTQLIKFYESLEEGNKNQDSAASAAPPRESARKSLKRITKSSAMVEKETLQPTIRRAKSPLQEEKDALQPTIRRAKSPEIDALQPTIRRPKYVEPQQEASQESYIPKIQEVRIHAQEQLKKIYEQLEQMEEKAPKKRTVRGAALSSVKQEKDFALRKIYLKSAMGIAAFLFIVSILFMYAMTGRIPVPVDPIPADASKPVVPIPEHQKAPKQTLQTLNHPFLKETISLFVQYSKNISHAHLNALLKRIHLEGKEHLHSNASGDLYNLIGRLYFYKIHLDREEELFTPEKKKIWQDEAYEAFKKAKEIYLSSDSGHFLILPIAPWMPDRLMYEGQHFIRYDMRQDAVADVSRWISRTKELGFSK